MASRDWGFFRAGGVDQVVLRSGADVEALADLDKKLWVALACPTQGTEIDEKTLALLDTDKDGRIRPPEILAAIDWASKVFESLDVLFDKGARVALDALDAGDEEGAAVLASAKRILSDRSKKDAKSIGLEDVVAVEEAFANTRLNGDGVVPPDGAEDTELAKRIEEIIAACGSVTDRSGKPGVDQALVDRFYEEVAELLSWEDEGEKVRAFGGETAAAYDALVAVEAKVEDYFTRCRIAAFEPRAVPLLAPSDASLGALGGQMLSPDRDDVASLPLAKIDASGLLPLDVGVNPAWAARMASFRNATVRVVLGADKRTLGEGEFSEIRAKLAAYGEWRKKKPTTGADKVPIERLREVTREGEKGKLDALIAADKALEPEYAKIVLVEKAVRLRRDLLPVLRNFVSFADFYGNKKGAFQVGTLFLDGRACNLCVRVNDSAKHAKLAGLAKAYLAYCDCTRTTAAGVVEKLTIVAAFTAGDTDNLMVGRNGVFYDRKGNDWDATIVSIVENPISIRQAFWAPYKKLLRLIEEQVAKRASEKEKEANANIDATATDVSNADKTTADPAAKKPPEKKIDVGTVAALGVAVAGFASFLGLLFGKFLDLGVWMPFGIAALLLGISSPSMVIAWLKLRQRNLGPILDASGWAVNAMCRINVPFGGSLTDVAALPKGATRAAGDPYAEKSRPWPLYAAAAVLVAGGLAWSVGKLDAYLPQKAQSKVVLRRGGDGSGAAPAPPLSSAASVK